MEYITILISCFVLQEFAIWTEKTGIVESSTFLLNIWKGNIWINVIFFSFFGGVEVGNNAGSCGINMEKMDCCNFHLSCVTLMAKTKNRLRVRIYLCPTYDHEICLLRFILLTYRNWANMDRNLWRFVVYDLLFLVTGIDKCGQETLTFCSLRPSFSRYRNWRYEQEIDGLLWKIDSSSIQTKHCPNGVVSNTDKVVHDGAVWNLQWLDVIY